MKDQELEARLARGLEQAAPHDLEGVLSRCETREGKVIPLTNKKRSRPVWQMAAAACLALVLAGGGAGVFYQNANAVASVVSIDVNPSMELRVNRDQKVLSCTPINEEARVVLGEMDGGKDLEGAKLTVAVNAIVGALVRHGYLEGLSNAILVSVEDKDQQRAQRMEEELRASIGTILEAQAPNTTVLSQTLTTEPGYDAYGHHGQAQQSISNGKAALVSQILAMNGNTDPDAFDKLAALTVEELSDLLETGETRIPIGRAAASLIVEEYAGTAALNSATTEVDPELDKRPAYYEVELHTPFGEFEYTVDAFTGEVLSGQADVVKMTQQTFTPGPETSVPPAATVPPAGIAPASLIGEEAAWAAACGHAGCALGDMSYTKCELDYEDGIPHCYELEFCWKGNQYEYEIDCRTGDVLKHGWEACDEAHHQHWVSSGMTVTVDPPAAPTGESLIGEEAAWAAVCGHAGCALGDLSYAKCEVDYEDDRPHCYELEFCWNGNQYEYEVDCRTGTVLQCEWEPCHNGLHGCRGGGGHHGYGHHG